MATARNRAEPPVNRRLGFEAVPKKDSTLGWVLKPPLIVFKDIKGLLHPYSKISMFCFLSQNYQHFFEVKISVGQSIFNVMDQNSKNIILINQSINQEPLGQLRTFFFFFFFFFLL